MGKKAGGKHHDVAERKEPLQAVLLADDAFSRNTFRPLNLDKPKALCPLNNVPLIEYAIDFLASARVEEVFVMCVADAVAEYVSKMRRRSLKITLIQDQSFLNAGDALRELDKRTLVKSDPFLLMHADTITNFDVTAAIELQKKRQEKDSAAIMTILMREAGHAQREEVIFGLDPDYRIYYYDQSMNSKSVRLPCSFITTPIDLRTDLVDCGIDICSPALLARFSDNFDYGDIRREFVANSVAEEEEGLQNIIHGQIVEGYASRVTDPYSYAQVSRDLLKRWCYPVVPDQSFEKEVYRMHRHYLYNELKAEVARSAKVQGPGMIGSSVIGENCKLTGCIIGNACIVEADCVLDSAYLWNNVEVCKGAVVKQSILAEGVIVKKGAFINKGCVIGAGCIVGENVVLNSFTRITMKQEAEDDFGDDWNDAENDKDGDAKRNDEDDVPASDAAIVGPDGKGHMWKPQTDDEECDDDENGSMSPTEMLLSESIGYEKKSIIALRARHQQEIADNLSDIEAEDVEDIVDEYSNAVTFSADAGPVPASEDIIGRQRGIDVVKELKLICMEYEITSPIENLAIELNSFKFSQNATYSDCVTAATMALLERMPISQDVTDVRLATEFKKSLNHWSPLLRKMSISIEEEKSIVIALERCATDDTEMGKVLSGGLSFRYLLTILEDEEVVSDEAIFAWAEERQDESDTPIGRLFRLESVQQFIAFLRERSEEEDDDDDDDGDEDDSEED